MDVLNRVRSCVYWEESPSPVRRCVCVTGVCVCVTVCVCVCDCVCV